MLELLSGLGEGEELEEREGEELLELCQGEEGGLWVQLVLQLGLEASYPRAVQVNLRLMSRFSTPLLCRWESWTCCTPSLAPLPAGAPGPGPPAGQLAPPPCPGRRLPGGRG